MSYLVDSDWIIDALTGMRSALQPLEENVLSGLAVSIVTLGELYEGLYNFPDPESHFENVRLFLSGFSVLPLTDPIMQLFARHRHRLRREGKLIPDFDLLIAATALNHGRTLMTRNVRHFDRIPDLKLFKPSRRTKP